MHSRLIASVHVDKIAYSIDRQFDYLIPPHLNSELKCGCRVLVPFGNGNKKVQGIVVNIKNATDFKGNIKPISAILDKESLLSEEMLLIVDYLVSNTFCTYYEAVKTVLPVGASVDIIETYELNLELKNQDIQNLTKNEQRLVDFLKTAKTAKELNTFLDYKGNISKGPVVKALIEKGVIKKTSLVKHKVQKKTVRMLKIADGFEIENLKLTPKQNDALAALNDVKTATIKELCYISGVSEPTIRNLIKKRIITQFNHEIKQEYQNANKIDLSNLEIKLSKKQQNAFKNILNLVNCNEPNAVLLHGITGSGKTQIYVKLIEEVIKQEKNAILLVPEIALTSQLVAKFKALFGDIIAVIHSGLSVAERMGEFNKIKTDNARVIIGTRSAIFSPIKNIGIIILDEEGEATYKSDQTPRYNAREIAKLRCVFNNATLLLGSATPSIESYYNASIGKYSLVTIDERYSNAILPSVYIVDMCSEQNNNNFSPLSDIIQKQIDLNIKAKEQSILLINRRGYNTIATCIKCDETITCPSCDVAMTYHKANGMMMCHYCGNSQKFQQKCPSCDSEYIKLSGVGTQKLEDELKKLFPHARILRMDTDTTYSKDAYEKNFYDFKQGKYDIMIGTQMIAKGLDFPNVTLVGVINADSGLYSNDFKSNEKVFSLITQVVGRSGRSEKPGRAYIQTREPQNLVIELAAKQDYKAFYDDEIQSRKLLTNPPFCDVCVIGFSGTNENAVKAAAYEMVGELKNNAKDFNGIAFKLLGATPANVHKISNKYRYRIIIKCKNNNQFRNFISKTLKQTNKNKIMNAISIYVDINGELNS